ncbi:LysR family transcriptional regulator [Uliginosibacterium sp. sgz301328]|uniref:LysR family transcriptional regulator n=1 Tax=Uliginosibacterium sp. sgz301328 TaxID=3243764 RepID=UPI00359E8D3E
MKIGQMKAFHAIHTLGSTVAAARQLGLSQSAVSSLLTQFEESLGFRLYEREKGRLLMRPEADIVFEQVQRVLVEADRLSLLADGVRHQRDGVLRLAIPGSLAETTMVWVLRQLREDAPDAKVSLYIKPYENIQDMVAEGKVDIGVVKLPIAHRTLRAVPLITSPTVIVMPPDHPLAALKTVSPRDLTGERLIILGGATTFWEEVERHMSHRGVAADIAYEVHDTRAACRLVEAGLGVAFANDLMAAQYRHLGITWRPFVPDIPHHFCLIHHEKIAHSRLFDRMCALLSNGVARAVRDPDAA